MSTDTMWFLAYLIPALLMFGGYAWLVGACANDPPSDPDVFPVLFMAILFWPFMLGTMLAVLPFALIANIAQPRAKPKDPTP